MNTIARLAVTTSAAVVALVDVAVLSPSPGHSATAKPGRLTVTEDGVRFSFRVPAPRPPLVDSPWARFRSLPTATLPGGPISLNRSIMGPQGAEAIVYWTSFPHGDHAEPCARLLPPSIGRSVTKLAAAVAAAPGTTLVEGPTEVILGGHLARRVVLVGRRKVGCDPGLFYRWRDVDGGPLWPTTEVGDTLRVWVVGVNGRLLFIAAATTTQASRWLKKEAQAIVESIRFG
jgi:hypothetical protein